MVSEDYPGFLYDFPSFSSTAPGLRKSNQNASLRSKREEPQKAFTHGHTKGTTVNRTTEKV